jgi:hypothetical protein
MAGKARLRKRKELVNWTVEIFDLEMDKEAKAEMADNPSAFVRNLFESEGMPVNNGLLVDDRTGTDGAEPDSTLGFHVTDPPKYRSRKGTIIVKAAEEETELPD